MQEPECDLQIFFGDECSCDKILLLTTFDKVSPKIIFIIMTLAS
jgi:hypothetical protein